MQASSFTKCDHSWYPDSGATHHITPDSNNLVSNATYTGNAQVHIGDGTSLPIRSIGFSSFPSAFNSKIFSLKHLLYVPSIKKNLLSVSKFASDNKVFFEFFPSTCFVRDQVTHKVLMQGKLKDGLYAFDSPQFLSDNPHNLVDSAPTAEPAFSRPELDHSANNLFVKSFVSSKQTHNMLNLWHNKLGHPGQSVVKTIMSECNVPHINKMDFSFCSACCLGKIHNLPYISSKDESFQPLQLTHTDLWGPSSVPSINGYKYYILFIDDFSKYTWIYMLKNKSEAFDVFCHFKTQVELQLGHKIKNLQSDWGGRI